MPSGNGAKKKQAQERHAKENAPKPGSHLAAQAASIKLICPNCKAPFVHENGIKPHYESKHPKLEIPSKEQCMR